MIELRHLATILALVLALILAAPFIQAAETHYARDAESGLESWEILDGGIRFSLTQMLPDQARAFFMGRGFDRAAAESYAQVCVFQAVMRNQGSQTIALRLVDWWALAGEKRLLPKLDAAWQSEWKQRGVLEPARIAFRWAQFPSDQIFEPGDWNQGMIAYPLPHGARFDLNLKWRANGQPFETSLKGVQCAEDR